MHAVAPEPANVDAIYLHCDVDKMYYSVEALETPSLADDTRAVIIGIHPREYSRGIVTTANAVARSIGITSGMSNAIATRIAQERGIDVVFVSPRHDVYAAYSRRLMDLLRTETPLLEQRSIDEAALDWRHNGFDGAAVIRVRERILDEIGLSVSFGVASSLLVAKMASEVAKAREDHVCLVRPGEAPAFLAPLSVRALVGIGPKSEARLRGFGINTIGDLASRRLDWLVDQFGSAYGRYLFRASRGEDDSTLVGERAWKSISAEHTFNRDTGNRAEIWLRLQAQAQDVAGRLQREQLVASEVAIKVRYGVTWETITRQQRLSSPTDDHTVLAAGAAALMRKAWSRRPIRLIGLRASKLEPKRPSVQLPLISSS
ncbi:MAG: DNA polymerase IV [Chloroflexota bacterium]|nr:DNA polymerase IV [Chloroflexota bacterium]